MSDSKYGKNVYIGFDQDTVTNYDQYYYTYSGERNGDYYTDGSYGKEETEVGDWAAETWSRKTT